MHCFVYANVGGPHCCHSVRNGYSERYPKMRPEGLTLLVCVGIIMIPACVTKPAKMGVGAKIGGGGQAGAKFGKGRLYSSRIPVTIQHRNPQSATYYEHKDGAKIVKSSHFDYEYMLGRKITFFCMARGMPRPEVTWFKDGIELYHHKYFQVHEWTEGNDTIKSKMEIDPATQKDAGFYECQANNKYAIDYRAFRTDYAMLTY